MTTETIAPTWVRVICAGVRQNGRLKGQPCNKLLCRVEVSDWELAIQMKGKVEIQCPECNHLQVFD